jgi:hypothetical protein
VSFNYFTAHRSRVCISLDREWLLGYLFNFLAFLFFLLHLRRELFIFVKDLMIMRKQRLATQAYTEASSSMNFPSLEGYFKIASICLSRSWLE